MPGGRKTAHVAADFGQDDASAQFVDAGNGGQEADGGAKGLDIGVDLLIDLIDRRIDGVDLLQCSCNRKRWCRVTRPRKAASNSSGVALIRR